jgi:hypothetical protein
MFTVTLHFSKETPGTYRYDFERRSDLDDPPPVTSVYVKKHAFPDGAPKSITVTVEAA